MRIFIVSLAVVVIDQITKLVVKYTLHYNQPVEIIGNFVRLTYIENPGMAFGLRVANPTFLTIFASFASIIIFIYIIRARHEKFFTRFALALILGGAIGNLIDRFLYGQVVDFIDIGIRQARWPVFNVADSAVSIGMIILVSVMLFDREKKAVEEAELSVKDQLSP